MITKSQRERAAWGKPRPGRITGAMHARPSPGKRFEPGDLMPREGQGDYRPPLRRTSGTRPDGYADRRQGGEALYFNPVRTELGGSGRGHEAAVYVARRNGMPEDKPYHWRTERSGWAARVAARNLDMAAITAADRELDGQRVAA